MTPYFFTSLIMGPVVGWLTTVSIILVVYLFTLEIREFRRNRRMDAERERLGLRRA